MTNAQRQPVVGKAVGNPNKGRPTSVSGQVKNTGNRFESKPLDDGKTDES